MRYLLWIIYVPFKLFGTFLILLNLLAYAAVNADATVEFLKNELKELWEFK